MRYSTFSIYSSTCRVPSKFCTRHGLAGSSGMADTDSIGTDDIAGDSDSTTDDTTRVADGGPTRIVPGTQLVGELYNEQESVPFSALAI